MPHQAEWRAGGRIIYVKYLEEVTLEEMDRIVHFFKPHFDAIDYTIHIVVDYTARPRLGVSLGEAMESEVAKTQFSHPNVGWVVYIANEDWHYFYLYASVMEDRLNANTRAFRTQEDALAFLKEQDETLKVDEVKPIATDTG